MLIPVIMAGGSGTRLWPLSRKLYPKQFHNFGDELTMLQATVRRLAGLPVDKPLLLCNEEHRFLAAEQLRQLGLEEVPILLEPEGRNTAPAIALAALHLLEEGDDPVLLVLAADHRIGDVAAFQAGVRQGLALAEAGKLVTFGIVPQSPETGYGYIQRGEELTGAGFAVRRFVEKPDAATAEDYLAAGDYYWNSGMFMFRAGRYLAELELFQPAMVAACRAALAGKMHDLHFIRVSREDFLACPADSIDYAVMEKTEEAALVPLDAGWCDLGSWSALWETAPRDGQGNVCDGDVLARDTRDCLLMAQSRLLATFGVRDLVVVETKDAVMVADRRRAQEVKALVEALATAERGEHITHREVFRPWGSYDSIDIGGRYQVKRIKVKPGARLSLQMHHHRAEHWIVVSGTAKVTKGDESYLVSENESTFIPLGQVHSLENPGAIPLELIEVQSGSYLGEDDIVRIEDRYGRA
ncbi:mannose-1-phosphate guanylyltransferase/mannose-6-phosphate isomerase [Desulfurivibrio alkaliphilus]|uniref:mannose-1-phosphate guanylyltransferase n=1 Tax=Desulfurivibrio alkaliphilus (strain DSM 19089 / UNIQEM U267 / AHT2) TaxID=589865 RepID=D6Z4P0_DESAT|nr:mannose-1-phosphate guanylyltransferase/mannose-6-phosphate isomerase [Desulfurivibrio alkaliphilus]ADH86515.1 mannose-1-phosphate guanylyltransferase/mannose-6-phosphate isomerase [Desulfurivibrio alkaliphilus AHT 2]